MMWYQQGDVTIKPAEIPTDAERIDSHVLAQGEAAGHAHRLAGDAELLRFGERLFLRVLADNVRVIHEEHTEIAIPPGEYEIGRVREYDHFEDMAQDVSD